MNGTAPKPARAVQGLTFGQERGFRLRILPPLRNLVALLLLGLWLPATLHCELEAAGIDDFFGLPNHHDGMTGEDGDDDARHSIDGVSYRLEFGVAKISTAAVTLFRDLSGAISVAPSTARPQIVAPTATAPPEVARAWQFTRRAAAPPRAPSAVS